MDWRSRAAGFWKQDWVLVFLTAAMTALVFVLSLAYRMPLEIPVYAGILLTALLAVTEVFRWIAYRQKSALLEAAAENARTCLSPLPEETRGLGALYKTVIEVLSRRCEQQEQKDRERLEHAQKYYTMWSHQIKTPIAGLHLLLQEEEVDRKMMERELFRTEQYVETVLQYQRLQALENDLLIRKYRVEEMVREALKRTGVLLVGQKVSVLLGNLEGTVVTDEKWFVFVLEQLIGNAAKYTRKGHVRIYLEEPGQTEGGQEEGRSESRFLVIEDTGIGIRQEDLPRIFEWGYTGLNGRSDKKATGIGLALCKETLDMLGHGIRVESQVGRGTRVYLDLSQKQLD